MAETADTLRFFLDAHPDCALVEVAEAKGSTPREAGAWMLVAPDAIFGTIGGGQLEWMAIDEARRLLCSGGEALEHPPALPVRSGVAQTRPLTQSPGGPATARRGPGLRKAILDIPLGPKIGQCCGGRVKLSIRPMDHSLRDALVSKAQAGDDALPHVLVFGAGHVGRALAAALALLPARTTVVETRAEALEGLAGGVRSRLTPVPEEAVRTAPSGSTFVILTHDHALDFLLAAEALKRSDAAYVGMIGSETKRATFRRWFLSEAGGTEEQFRRVVCPIGGSAVRDKRPAVIAALATAEIVQHLL